MVDVTGIEPATPCLQSRPGKTLTALSGIAYTENRRDFRSLRYPEVVPNSPQGAVASRVFLLKAAAPWMNLKYLEYLGKR